MSPPEEAVLFLSFLRTPRSILRTTHYDLFFMILTVHVKPNSKETGIVGWRDGQTLILKLKSPAKEGRANRELIDFLAKHLKLPKSYITIKRGHSSRVKHIQLPDGIDLRMINSTF